MARKTYYKLGENAKDGSFYDPVSKISLVQGEVAQAPDSSFAKTSTVLKNALANGHVIPATEDEYQEYLAQKEEDQEARESKKTRKIKAAEVEVEDEDIEDPDEDEEVEEDDEDEDEGGDMTKDELIKAITASGGVPADKKKNLAKLKKEELQDIYDEYVN